MKFRPLGNLVMLELSLGGELVSEQGIIYEKTITPHVWGRVIAMGPGTPFPKTGKILPNELKVGDEVLVLFRKMKGTHTEGLYTGEERVYHLYDRDDIICAKEN